MVYLVWSATFWVAALTTTTTLTDAWAPPPRLIQSSCTFSKPLSSTQKKSSTSRLFLASWKEHDPYVNIGNHERITPSYNNYNHVSWGEEDEHRHHPNNHDAREGRSVNFQNNVNHEIHHNVHSFQPDNWHVNSYNNNNGNNNGNHQRNSLNMRNNNNNNVSINRSTLAQRSGGINNRNHHDRFRRNPNSQFVGWDGRPDDDDGYHYHHGPEHRGYAAVDDRWDDEEHDHYPRPRRHGGRDHYRDHHHHHHRPKQYAGTLHRNSKDGTRMVGEDGYYYREEDDRDYHHRDDYEYDYHDDYHSGLDYRRNSNSRLAPYYQERGHRLEAPRHRRSRHNSDDHHDDYHYYGDEEDEEDYYDHDDFDHHYSGGRRRHRDRGLVMEVMDDTYQALDDLWHDTNHVLNRMSDMVRTTMKRGKNHHRGSMMRLNNRRRRRANRHLFVDPRHFADFAPTRHGRSLPAVRHHDEEDIASLLHEAEDFMNHDPACTNVLGDDIHAGRIHSQSASASSSSSTRGHRHRHDDDDRMETKLEFAVRGSYEAGTAQLWASEWGVEEILVRVPEERGYREIVVDLMSTSGHHHRRRRHHRHHHDEADVVDAEII